MSSNIRSIVDYTAAKAAGIQGIVLPNGETVGVRSIYGAGQGIYDDPLRPGQTIQPAPESATEPLMHVSRLPDAPTIEWISQTGTVELTWTIQMSLFIARGDAATAAQVVLPFYDAYLAAFTADPMLGGLCMVSRISSFKTGTDESWCWLDVDLEVLEQVSY